MYLLKIAFRSLLFRKRQYVSLFLVCVFGVAISLFSIFLINGMLISLSSKAKIYYGGDLQFLRGDTQLNYWEVEKEIESIKDIFPEAIAITPRYDLDAKTSAFYYEGVGVRQRVIKGVDFVRESELFSKFNYLEGDASEIDGTNGVLLSEPIAQMLTVKCGDVITFMLYDCHGYLNTVELVVKGIFRDSSLFGMYTSYLDIKTLRKAFGYEKFDYANRIAISFKDGELTNRKILSYYEALKEKFNMFQMVRDKRTFYNSIYSTKEPTYALIPLSANLQDVQILIDAMKGISSFVIVMLVVIIVAGIGSTYRVLVMKRINEIGIYMAIGTKRKDVYLMLLFESIFLLIFGCFCGFILSQILSLIASNMSFSFIPAFDIFLVNGYLKPVFDLFYSCNLIFVILVFTLIAVTFAVKKSVNVTPIEALSVTE